MSSMLVSISAPSGTGKDTIIRGVYALVVEDEILHRLVEIEDVLDGLVDSQNYPTLPYENELPTGSKELRTYLRESRIKRMNELDLWVVPARSMVSRPKKKGEADDTYIFVSEDYFIQQIEQGKLLEHVVYVGDRYGTPIDEVERIMSQGKIPMKQIEAQGVQKIRDLGYPAYVIMIDVSNETLEQRLIERGRDSREAVNERLDIAIQERKILKGLADLVIYNESDISYPRQAVYSALLTLRDKY